jgi:hypothetical protein
MSTGRHVVIENQARWPASVWEHDGDEPIALFMHAADAHLFNAAPDLVEALQALLRMLNEGSDDGFFQSVESQMALDALAKAGT